MKISKVFKRKKEKAETVKDKTIRDTVAEESFIDKSVTEETIVESAEEITEGATAESIDGVSEKVIEDTALDEMADDTSETTEEESIIKKVTSDTESEDPDRDAFDDGIESLTDESDEGMETESVESVDGESINESPDEGPEESIGEPTDEEPEESISEPVEEGTGERAIEDEHDEPIGDEDIDDEHSEPIKEKRQKRFRMSTKEIVICLGIATVVAVAVMLLSFPTKVKGTSMQPTLQPNDRLVVSKQAYRIGKIKRGDIIVFESGEKEKKSGKNKLLIKRVIAIPDDIITISDGNVYMNGSKMTEVYTAGEPTDGDIRNLKIKKGEVFVMGDHRSVSNDSRWMGCIKQSKVKGKAVFRFAPLKKMGAL